MSVHNADDQANAPRFYSIPPEQMVQRPPKFSGDDDVDPMDFLDAFESACDWNNWVTDHRKLMVVRQCLTGSARRRMEKFHGDVVGYKEGKEKSFLARFRKEYVTSEWLAAYRRAYSRREQQEGETASKYFMTMLDLLKRADPNGMTREGDVVAVIRGGLLPQYTFHFMTFAKLQESKVDNEEGDITLEQLSEILKMVDQCTTPKIVRGMDHVIKPNNRMGNSMGVHAVDYGQKRNDVAENDPFESRINARLQYMENEMFNFMDRLEAKFGAVDAPRARNAGPGSECYNCHENGHSSRECINPSTRSQQVRRCTWRTPGFSVGPSTSGQEGQTDKRNPEKLLKRSNDKKPVLNNMVGCIEAESIEREYVPIYAAEPSNTKKEGRTEKEEAIYQQRLKNLAKARAALNEQRKLDKEAVARGEVAPSLIKKAMKQVPTIMDPTGQIRKFNMEQALWNMTVPVPFPQLMYHAPELRLEVLDKMGAAPKITARVKREEDPSDAMETNTSSIVASKGNRKTEVSHVQVDTTAETLGTGLQTVLAAVEDETIAFLVDGGASVSILPKYWIDKLGKTNQIQKPVGEQLKVLRFGGGDTEETVGIITLDLLLSEDVEVRQSFYVVMNQHTPCILGIDFLTKARVMFDAEEQCLYFRVRDTEGTEEDTIYVVPTHPGNGRGGNHAYDGVLDADENHVVAINVMNAENRKEQIVYLAESLVLSSGEVQFVRLDLHEQAKYWDHEQMLESGIHLVRKGVVMIPAMLAKDRPYYVVLLNASEQSVKLNHGDMLGRMKPVKQKSTESIDIMTSMEEIAELLNHLYRGIECYQLPSVQEGPWFLPTTELVTSLQREHQHVIDINSCVLEPASEKAKSSVEPQDNDSRLEGFDIDKGLDSEQKKAIQELIIKYRHVFATSLRDVQAVKAPPYKIQLKENATPKKVTPRMVPHDANLWFKGFIEELLAMNLIEPCTGPWAAAVVLIPADRDKRKPRRRRKFQAVRNPPKLKLNKASDPVPLWSVEINVADGHHSDSEAELSDEPSEQIFQGIYPKAPPPRKKANDIKGQRSEFTSVVPKGQAGNKDPYRLCLDYQPVNAETVDSAYPIPNINFLFTLLTGAKYFTLFDALKGYWQLELDEESRDLTGFTTTFGQFRWTRLPMGLKGAPGAWQSVMNDIFSEELLKYFVIYIDDGLVFSKSFQDHIKHLEQVLAKASAAGLSLSLKKCKFGYTETKVLGYMVGREGFKMDMEKVSKIINWPRPKNLTEVMRWIGMIQYYRRFIPALSEILSPLNELKKKGVTFKWGEEQQISFDHCKKLLISEPVLAHPDFNRTFVLYTDASDIGIGGVLSQESLETANVLHPIYFGSKALTEPEKNLSVYEREFLAVVYFIHFFKVYLMGKRFIAYTDQKALQYLKKFNEDSSAKIVRWLSSLLAYDFDIKYRPGKLNSNADALSRLPEEVSQGLEFEEVIEDNYLPLYTAVLEERSKRLKIDSDRTSAPITMGMNKELYNALVLYRTSLKYVPHYDEKQRKAIRCQAVNYEVINGELFKRASKAYPRRWVVATDKVMSILKENHDHWMAGHQGVQRTFDRIKMKYYWPGYYNTAKAKDRSRRSLASIKLRSA